MLTLIARFLCVFSSRIVNMSWSFTCPTFQSDQIVNPKPCIDTDKKKQDIPLGQIRTLGCSFVSPFDGCVHFLYFFPCPKGLNVIHLLMFHHKNSSFSCINNI